MQHFWNHRASHCISVMMMFMLLEFQHSSAQGISDSVRTLPAFEIRAERLDGFTSGIKTDRFDSLTVAMSSNYKLSDLLDKNTVLYTKNYGAGNLATLSFRGTSSSQSGIYWNGFNLKPPGAGMIDLSLIPVFFFNSLNVQYGGSVALYGSGNLGGSLHLTNESLLGNEDLISAGITAGSFGELQQQWMWKIQHPGWGSSTAIQHYSIVNNYPYAFNNQQYKRTQAGILQSAVMQNFEKQWGNNHLDIGCWLQQSKRDIPASITSADLKSDRTDNSLRFTSRWKKATGKGLWTAGLAVFHDYLRYREIPGDTIVLLDSKILNTSVMANIAFNTELKHFKTLLSAGINLGFNTININTYGGYKEQKQAGVFLLITQPFFHKQWKASLTVRKETADGYLIPLAPAAGLEGKVFKNLTARMHIAKNYRIPSMNDRYWIPGGNKDLKPEWGYNGGSGLQWLAHVKSYLHMILAIDGFYSNIYDWISWTPTSAGYFMAMNIQQVKIKGLELSVKEMIRIEKMELHLTASWSAVDAINQKKLNVYDLSQGKQLIYTPRQRFSGSILLRWNKLLADYNQSFTGKCFTNRENTEFVASFSTANLQIQYQLQFSNRIRGNAQVDITNLWDTQYEVVKYYPMPGRAIRAGVNFTINYNRKRITL